MSHKPIIISFFVILSLLLTGFWADALAAPLNQPDRGLPADLPGYGYQIHLQVHNNSTTDVLPSGYTVSYTLDTATLIPEQMQDDCDDLRITYNGGTEAELDRLVSGCNTATTLVLFRTQASIAASGLDTNYFLYYGNAGAGAPPSNPVNVFAFYDDFQDGDANGWTVTKGTWGIVNDAGNYIYRYTGGGANWPLTYASVPLSDLDYIARIRATDSPKTNWIGLAFRILDPSTAPDFLTFYQSRDTNNFKYGVITNDNHANPITSPPFTMPAGAWYKLHIQALGNIVRARIWLDGTTEPSSWNISTTTITYQSSTNIGLTLYNHTTNADWDDIQVRRLVATEPTVEIYVPIPTITVTANSGQSKVIGTADPVFTYTYSPSDPPVTFTGALSRVPGENVGTYAITQGTLAASGYSIVFVSADFTITPRLITTWYYRAPITVTNTSATQSLQVKYTAMLTLDTSALISSGRMLPTCNDLKIGSVQNTDVIEIDRVVENCNTANSLVWFALQRPISPSGEDTGYFLYYGEPSPGLPLANGMNVFLFFEDWEQGTTHWTGAGGLDPAFSGTMGTSVISSEQALSPSNSQKYTTRSSGGDAFSGFIPVLPSTGYAINLWAQTPSVGVCVPVGLDPYTSGYVKGTENWLWLNNWPTPSSWLWRSGSFSTDSTTAYIKIKSELWNNPGCPGTPVYLDNLALRFAISSEPTLTLGPEETTLVVPVITNIQDNGPVDLGSPITINAEISTTEGGIDIATLRIVSPISVDVPMSMISGSGSDGIWQASYTPLQGGEFSYRIRAHSTNGTQTTSPLQTFSVTDSTPPVITQLSFTNPILVNNTQTVTANVTDNGAVSSVSLTVGGVSHPMTKNGDQYSYAWKVTMVGEIPFTVTATDSANNSSHQDSSFTSQAREVDICTWKDCRQGAASWSIDDGNSSCRTELEAAGIRGTFFYNGSSTPSWFSTYSTAGHEIASHTVGHPCNTPACSPNCTAESLAAIPVDASVENSYRINQFEPNIAAIEAGTGLPVLTAAWPCGCTDPSRWTAAQSYVLGARGYYDYIAELAWLEDVNLPTPANLFNLNTAHTYRQDFVDQAYTEGKWSTTTSHGSCDGISYIGQQNTNGHLWVAPIGEVLKYIYVRDASQFSNYIRDDLARTISFNVVHGLTTFQPQSITTPTPYSFLPIQFNNPVTLKIHILESDTVLGVTIDDIPVDPSNYAIQTIQGTRFVTFDAAIDTTRHVHVNLAAPAPAISEVTDTDPVEIGSSAQVTAIVIPAVGTTLDDVTLHVISPTAQDYPMSVISGDQYGVSFTPNILGSYSYRVIATNTEGSSTQTSIGTFLVRDTVNPAYQNQAQQYNEIPIGGSNLLSVQGRDLGNLAKVVLSTDESGTWHDFDWTIADWWNQDWQFRKTITVTNSTTNARPNHLVDLLVQESDFDGLTSCNDPRVVDFTQVELPVQVYGTYPTCHLLFQVNVPASSYSTYYIYYGNPTPPVPSYTTDLTAVNNANVITIQNTYLDLDLDANQDGGVISRMRYRLGSNPNLPLSSESNAYWGWHQVCSTTYGNITGKNSFTGCGPNQASGLIMEVTLSGPLVREYTFTSVKAASTYTIKYRFFANSPYYEYSITQTGTTSVMNNFWYINGNFSRLGYGIDGGTTFPSYNTYSYGTDYFKMVSQVSINAASIDGTDNDGTDLGGSDYSHPTAPELALKIVVGSSDTAANAVLAELVDPLAITVSPTPELRPGPIYGSPYLPAPGTGWITVSFPWENDSILTDQWIHWKVTFYDVSGHAVTTPEMEFALGAPTDVILSAFTSKNYLSKVQLDWETANELDLVGFNLYRSTSVDGVKQQLNDTIIPAKNPGRLIGGAYQFNDPVNPGEHYYYWLELVLIDGTSVIGPIEQETLYWLLLPISMR